MARHDPKLQSWGTWPPRVLLQLQVFPLFDRAGIVQYVPRENWRVATIRTGDLYIHKVIKVSAGYLLAVLILRFLSQF